MRYTSHDPDETLDDTGRARRRPARRLTAVRAEVAKAVVGQDAAVSGLLVALLSGGHVLMEGVPGVAKTLLVRTLAGGAGGRHQAGAVHPRPDARRHHRLDGHRRPRRRADVPRGPAVHQPAAGRRDQPDPAEDPVGAARGDGGGPGLRRRRHPSRCRGRSWSPRPRTRWSTKAPTRCPRRSSTGSCSRWSCRCPSAPRSWQILRRHADGFDPHDIAAAGRQPGRRCRATSRPAAAAVRTVAVSPEVAGYVVDIARATRVSPSLSLGVSPRGATALLRTSRAWAWLQGRDFVTPDDVKALAGATLAHRLGAAARGRARGRRGRPRCCRARSTRCPCRDER